jgi:hypothetical protein
VGPRRAKLRFGEPIDMKTASELGRTKEIISNVTEQLEQRIEQLLL